VVGIRIDYLSIIFYLTDLVWLGWVGIHYRNEKRETRNGIKKLLNFQNLIFCFVCGGKHNFGNGKVGSTLPLAPNWTVVADMGINKKLERETRNVIKRDLGWIVPIWIIFEAFLGLAQIIKGGSLNGIWWWLGERRFTYGGIGIAQFRVFDQAWIRAYGTFSHPNSLAGFCCWRGGVEERDKNEN